MIYTSEYYLIYEEVSFSFEQTVIDRVVVDREQLELCPASSCHIFVLFHFQRILCHHLFLDRPAFFSSQRPLIEFLLPDLLIFERRPYFPLA